MRYNIQAKDSKGNFTAVAEGVSAEEAEAFISEQERREHISDIIEQGMNDIFAKLCDAGFDVKDTFPNELIAIQETESDLTELVLDMLKFRNDQKD